MKKEEKILLFLSRRGIDLEEIEELHVKNKAWDRYPNVLVVPKKILSKGNAAAFNPYSNSIFLNKECMIEPVEGYDGETFYVIWVPWFIETLNHESMHWVLLKLFNGDITASYMFDNIYFEAFKDLLKDYYENETWIENSLNGWYEENGELKFP